MRNIGNDEMKDLISNPVNNKFEQIKACLVVLKYTIIDSYTKRYNIDETIAEFFIKLPRNKESVRLLNDIYTEYEEHESLHDIAITYSRETFCKKSIPTISLTAKFNRTDTRHRGNIPLLNAFHDMLLKEIAGIPKNGTVFVDKETWTIANVQSVNTISIDTEMAEVICDLNKLGIETLYCCEGHVDNVGDLYILAKYSELSHCLFNFMCDRTIKHLPHLYTEYIQDHKLATGHGKRAHFKIRVKTQDDKVLAHELIRATIASFKKGEYDI